MDDHTHEAIDQYVTDLFAREDEALQWIQAETQRNNMPQISLDAHEGRLLQFLARSVGARKVVEIGTLAGYSGTWLARALPADGKLYTLEVDPKHARVARASFERSGVIHKVELLEGPALQSLDKLKAQGPFDFVFIDADKGSYPQYLNWAVDHLRPGGMLAAHNALRGGSVVSPSSSDEKALDDFNRAIAADSRLFGLVLSIGDGMAAAIKQ